MASNGDVERAELEALLASDPEQQMAYVVTCAFKTKKAVDRIPDDIAKAIQEQRAKDRRMVAALAGAIATLVSVCVPVALHFI